MTTSINLLGGSSSSHRDPELSPAGTAGTAPLSQDTLTRNAELVEQWADRLYRESARTIMEWAGEHAPSPLVMTMSMENTVLAELSARHFPGLDIIFLDTDYHFPETLDVAGQVERRYPDNRLIRVTSLLTQEEQDQTYGRNLYRGNPGACCRMRKVEPMAAALSPYAGMIDGLRRDDGPSRATAPALSLHRTGRLKISPMITWTLAETEEYLEEHDLIVHPLTRQGYPSIGCAPCTMPVAEGQDPRAGRWAGSGKTECGLHT